MHVFRIRSGSNRPELIALQLHETRQCNRPKRFYRRHRFINARRKSLDRCVKLALGQRKTAFGLAQNLGMQLQIRRQFDRQLKRRVRRCTFRATQAPIHTGAH